MKTRKEIEKKLKDLDAIETFDYGNERPISDWVRHQDLGWRAALKWVLDKEEEKAPDSLKEEILEAMTIMLPKDKKPKN